MAIRSDSALEFVPVPLALVDIRPGVLVSVTFGLCQIAEVEFHIQMTGDDVQNDAGDLFEVSGNTSNVGKPDPDIAELLLFLHKGCYTTAGDGVADSESEECQTFRNIVDELFGKRVL